MNTLGKQSIRLFVDISGREALIESVHSNCLPCAMKTNVFSFYLYFKFAHFSLIEHSTNCSTYERDVKRHLRQNIQSNDEVPVCGRNV